MDGLLNEGMEVQWAATWVVGSSGQQTLVVHVPELSGKLLRWWRA